MTNKKPLVSYIIPCFNQTKMLHEAVSSAVLSYAGPRELLVINDCSTEPGWETQLNELGDYFPEVQVIHNTVNKGLSATRNLGIAACHGEYIQLLDSDDFLAPKKIDYQLDHFRLVEDLSISVTDYLLCDEDLSYFYTSEPCLGTYAFALKDFLYKWERGLSIPIHCGLFRRDVFEEFRFTENLCGKEDWVFWCHQAYQNRRIAYLNIVGAIYRQHEKSMTKADPEKMGQNWLKAAQLINLLVGETEPDFLSYAQDWFHQFYQKGNR